ncbi:MAG: glutathione S-transferase family protein [Alphaproteobacteria bacterium]
MLKLYHAPRTRSARVIWLLEELGDVAYEVIETPFKVPTDHIHHQNTPRGKFPTLDDDGLILFESGAIIDHILYHHGRGRLQPETGTAEWALYRQWFTFAESTGATAINVLLWYLYMERDVPGAENVIARMQGWVEDNITAFADGLGAQQYIVGDSFTAADIMMGYTLNMMTGAGSAFPANVQAYFDRITTRPSFEIAMAGEPFR